MKPGIVQVEGMAVWSMKDVNPIRKFLYHNANRKLPFYQEIIKKLGRPVPLTEVIILMESGKQENWFVLKKHLRKLSNYASK